MGTRLLQTFTSGLFFKENEKVKTQFLNKSLKFKIVHNTAIFYEILIKIKAKMQ